MELKTKIGTMSDKFYKSKEEIVANEETLSPQIVIEKETYHKIWSNFNVKFGEDSLKIEIIWRIMTKDIIFLKELTYINVTTAVRKWKTEIY